MTYEIQSYDDYHVGQGGAFACGRRKTKIVCTIGPSSSSREMIWKLAETGMNVARLNMSHGDHTSHQKTIDLVKEYNSQFKDKVIAIMLDTKVHSHYIFVSFFTCSYCNEPVVRCSGSLLFRRSSSFFHLLFMWFPFKVLGS